MSQNTFSLSQPLFEIAQPPLAPTSACKACSRHKGCYSPCLDVGGTPGLPTLVLEAPTAWEDDEGKALLAPEGLLLKSLMTKCGYKPGTYNVVYALGCNGGAVTDSDIAICQQYLRHKLEALQPSRILSFGTNSGFALTGEHYDEKSVRKGIRWLDVSGTPTPVFLLMTLGDLVANSTKVNPMREDLAFALSANPKRKQYSYKSIKTPTEAFVAMQRLVSAPFVAFDVETTGTMHDPQGDFYCTSISFWPARCVDGVYVAEDTGYVFHLGIDLDGLPAMYAQEVEEYLSYLRDILCNAKLVGWNSKYDSLAVSCDPNLAVLVDPVSDTRIKRKLLEADADGTLATSAELVGWGGHKHEAESVLDQIKHDISAIAKYATPSVKKRKPLSGLKLLNNDQVRVSHIRAVQNGASVASIAYGYLPEDICDRYNCMDTLTTCLLECLINSRLDADKMAVWNEVCLPASRALTQMESYGIGVDTTILDACATDLQTKIATVTSKIQTAIGNPNFNPGSSLQIRGILGQLGINVKKKTDKGSISTGEMALEPFKKNPVIADILEYRRLKKLLGTYCEGLKSCVVNGRIHASFLQGGTETGRVSCSDPNLQNIPTATSSSEAKAIRSAFVAGPGRCFVEADYGQLEIRIAAWLSEDPKMIEVLASGVDFHQRTAEMICWVWNVGPDGIDEEKRKEAKTANFAVLYELPDRLGMMLANRLGCSRTEGQRIADAIFGQFSRLRKWMDECLANGQRLGGTHTYWNGDRVTASKITGRFRPLWKLGTSIPAELGIKDSHKRSTWNGAVQGTAGDLATASLEMIQRQLDVEAPGAKVVVTIHDSITVECEESQSVIVAGILKSVMTRYKLLTLLKDKEGNAISVPLIVDFKKGTDWGSMQKYKPEF